MKRIFLVTMLFLASTAPVTAESTVSVKIDAVLGYDAKIKGVPCKVVIDGVETKFTTPAKIELPTRGKGMLWIEHISCSHNGITRQIDKKEMTEFNKMEMNFEEPTGMVILFY